MRVQSLEPMVSDSSHYGSRFPTGSVGFEHQKGGEVCTGSWLSAMHWQAEEKTNSLFANASLEREGAASKATEKLSSVLGNPHALSWPDHSQWVHLVAG